MSYKDAQDTRDDPHASQTERRLAGDLMDVWNRIRKLEGDVALLRKEFEEYKKHCRRGDCPHCKAKDSLRNPRMDERVTGMICVKCGKVSDE